MGMNLSRDSTPATVERVCTVEAALLEVEHLVEAVEARTPAWEFVGAKHNSVSVIRNANNTTIAAQTTSMFV